MTQQTQPRITRKYPCTVRLNNNTEATIRRVTRDDADRIVTFARGLPEEDSLFLRTDITDPAVVQQWLQKAASDRMVTLVAEISGQMAGYVLLDRNDTSWQRHLGEVRIQVGRAYRGSGLGRALATEIFQVARDLELQKLIAQMTPDQKGAIATFERLGFQPEALLQDFVCDRQGRTRDLVVMSHDVTGLTDQVN